MELTSENVQNLFKSCLYKKGENETGTMVVKGLINDYKFKNSLIEENKVQIKELLLQLDPNFLKSSDSKGWSFLQVCTRKDGVQWTDLHIVMEALVVLGEEIPIQNYIKLVWKVKGAKIESLNWKQRKKKGGENSINIKTKLKEK